MKWFISCVGSSAAKDILVVSCYDRERTVDSMYSWNLVFDFFYL